VRSPLALAGRVLVGTSTFDVRSADLSNRRLVSFVLWRVPLLLLVAGAIWEPVRGVLWSGGFAWIGLSCTANACKCGRVHCALMGPLFLALSAATAVKTAGAITVGWTTLGLAGVASVLVSYLPEWFGHRYLRSGSECDPEECGG
jgi:hypothetical protein